MVIETHCWDFQFYSWLIVKVIMVSCFFFYRLLAIDNSVFDDQVYDNSVFDDQVYPGVIKPCEEELLANLTRFHDDLLKFEKSLVNARTGMQVKLRKEVDSYLEPKMEVSTEDTKWATNYKRDRNMCARHQDMPSI